MHFCEIVLPLQIKENKNALDRFIKGKSNNMLSCLSYLTGIMATKEVAEFDATRLVVKTNTLFYMEKS
jgi:hypothetical protein